MQKHLMNFDLSGFEIRNDYLKLNRFLSFNHEVTVKFEVDSKD